MSRSSWAAVPSAIPISIAPDAVLMLVLPLLTLVSRLYLGAHHLTDALTSVVYGSVWLAVVALLVLPWVGFLLNSWLGLVVGIVLYGAARVFAPEEEVELSERFGPRWDAYRTNVRIPWA